MVSVLLTSRVPRVCIGIVVALLKLVECVIRSLCRGRQPRLSTYAFSGTPLGAAADPSLDLRDVWLKSRDGTSLHAVVDDGLKRRRAKPALVFLHGFPELWISWRAQIQHFVGLGHPIVALTLRGSGLSDKPDQLHAYHLYDALADDVAAAVAFGSQLCPDTLPCLVAHDWGAAAMWAYIGATAEAKLSISRIVSFSVPPWECYLDSLRRDWRQRWASTYVLGFNSPRLPELLFGCASGWLPVAVIRNECSNDPDPVIIRALRANVAQPKVLTSGFNYYRAALQYQPWSPQHSLGRGGCRLKVPTLFVHGEEDVYLLSSLYNNVHQYIADCEVITLPRCSHWVQMDRPNETCTLLEKFCK